MKINRIKINGTRGFVFVKDESGEPNPHVIDLEKKHLLVYGENGTGKSSFFDSLEWCLTGVVPEIKKRRVENSDDFIKNKFCDKNDIPFVEIEFDCKTNTRFKRELKRGNSDYPYKEISANHFIETNRIENFVIDKKKSLWDRFLLLLGLQDLIVIRDQLLRLKNVSEKKKEESEEKFSKSKSNYDTLKKEVDELEKKIETNIEPNWKNQSIDTDYNALLEKRNNLEKAITELKNLYGEIDQFENEKNIKSDELTFASEKVIDSRLSNVIDETLNYFLYSTKRVDVCPVCKKPFVGKEYEQVLDRLKGLQESFANILKLKKDIKQLESKIVVKNEELRKSKQKFFDSYKILYKNDLTDKNDEEIKEILTSTQKQNAESIKSLEKYSNAPLQQSIGEYKTKIQELDKLYENYLKYKHDNDLKTKVYDDIDAVFNSYKKAYSERIKEELSLISKQRVNKIYRIINETDNESVDEFLIEPDIENENITFKAKLSNNNEWIDALTILSTAHLRCLGFSLLIARIQESNSDLKFIVIDDPIYSIDHEHRYNLVNYLKDLSKDYQLIITTSDLNFFDILRNNFESGQIKVFKTYFNNNVTQLWNISIKESPSDFIREAEDQLEKNDLRAASLYVRLALETRIMYLAKKIKLKFPIDRINRIGIRDIFESKFKEELKQSFKEKEVEVEKNIMKLQSHRFFNSLINGFPLDQLVHAPEDKRGFLYSKAEIKSIIDTIKEFIVFSERLLNKTDKS